MSEREIAALMRGFEADTGWEEPEVHRFDDILDAEFDEDETGPRDHVDRLSAHLRRRSSMVASLGEDVEPSW